MILAFVTTNDGTFGQWWSACALDAFFDAVKGVQYKIGVTNIDINNLYDWTSYQMINVPELVSLTNNPCELQLSCDFINCRIFYGLEIPSCTQYSGGQMIPSDDPDIKDKIKKMLFQEYCSGYYKDCEAGLEAAFRQVFERVKTGKLKELSQLVVIGDEKNNEGGRICKVQQHRYDPENIKALQEVLGTDFDPPVSPGAAA